MHDPPLATRDGGTRQGSDLLEENRDDFQSWHQLRAEIAGLLAMCHMMCHNLCMTSVNIRQLRDTRKLKAWLRAGKTVVLRERNRVIARIVPEPLGQGPVSYPDFAARAKKLLGNRVLSGADLVIEERGRF
jgi:hypothetical protein